MPDKKYTYRVRPGRSFGAFKEFGPGSTLQLTADEAAGFPDTLVIFEGDGPAEAPFDAAAHLKGLTVAQLQKQPEWDEIEAPKPTRKDDIIAAILAVREGTE